MSALLKTKPRLHERSEWPLPAHATFRCAGTLTKAAIGRKSSKVGLVRKPDIDIDRSECLLPSMDPLFASDTEFLTVGKDGEVMLGSCALKTARKAFVAALQPRRSKVLLGDD